MLRRLALLLLILIPASAHAQARLAVYASAGAEHSQFNGQVWTKAAILGAYAKLLNLGPLNLSADARVDLSMDTQTYLIGPRFALHVPFVPLKPYAEVLLGGIAYTTLQGQSAGSFVTRYAGGIDTAVLPRIDWRIVEVEYGHEPAEPAQNSRIVGLTTGLVLRF